MSSFLHFIFALGWFGAVTQATSSALRGFWVPNSAALSVLHQGFAGMQLILPNLWDVCSYGASLGHCGHKHILISMVYRGGGWPGLLFWISPLRLWKAGSLPVSARTAVLMSFSGFVLPWIVWIVEMCPLLLQGGLHTGIQTSSPYRQLIVHCLFSFLKHIRRDLRG